MASKSSTRNAELSVLVNRMNREQRRVVRYLMCLLLERQVRPSEHVDREIERLQHEVAIGMIPSVPSVQ